CCPSAASSGPAGATGRSEGTGVAGETVGHASLPTFLACAKKVGRPPGRVPAKAAIQSPDESGYLRKVGRPGCDPSSSAERSPQPKPQRRGRWHPAPLWLAERRTVAPEKS